MFIARFLTFVILMTGLSASQTAAQSAVPEHRYLFSRDVDFFGADLTPLFNTTQSACERACAASQSCAGFTFNSRSNACFPKSEVEQGSAYVGAISARKVLTDPNVRERSLTREAELGFLAENDLSRARGFVQENARDLSLDGAQVDELLAGMRQAETAGNLALALRGAAMATALSDRADIWAAYAEIAQRRSDQVDRGNRRTLRQIALSAAINSYLRAEAAPLRAQALNTLATSVESLGRGRDMIPALRLAETLSGRQDISQRLDDAIGKYGFRIVDHRVDNDAAAPRICAEFSEPLLQGGVDYLPFVRVEGPGLAVVAEDATLCIEGVTHGSRYNVTFRKGLPAAQGEVLHRDVSLNLYVRDRGPVVRFPGRAYVLPRGGAAALPIETVNVDTVELRLRRVSDRNLVRAIRQSYFGKPLSQYEDEVFAAELAQEIWQGTATVQNTLNTEMTTRLPLAEALAGQAPGIYTLSAAYPGQDLYESPAATQWFVLSDLGLSTWLGTDGLTVAARSLTDASAQGGVRLTLISRANAVLGEVQTGSDGFAQFDAGLTRGNGAAAPALLMARLGETDIAFLPLTDPAFDLSDRGVEGHPPAPALDAFLTTDRGAYRVGEVIYATALLRDEQAQGVPGVPMTAVLKRPDGVEYARQVSAEDSAGGHVFALPLGGDVARGSWRLDLFVDPKAPALASTVVLVEDFVPERIDYEISLPTTPVPLEGGFNARVDARYLFGAPGADLSIEGTLRLRGERQMAGWPGYMFGRHNSGFTTQARAVPLAKTDATGRAELMLALPEISEHPGQPLTAELTLRLTDGGGRPVERQAAQSVAATTPLIGIKPAFEGELPEGASAQFDLVAIAPNGVAMEMPVRWAVNRVQTRYQWYQLYGNWEWEPITRRTRVASGEARLGTLPQRVEAATEWGQYELVVESAGAPYAASSVAFQSGWYGGGGETDTPDRLALSLDAETYAVGDTARLRIAPEDAGVALVTVLSNRVIDRRVVPVSKGDNLITLPVTPAWGSGAYVTASVLRGMDADAGQNPARRLGLVHAKVQPGQRALGVNINAPETVDGQEGIFEATVDVTGMAPGDTAYVTLAAVDVGVLNLTGFQAPDVTDHYFGQRRLGVDLRDLYGRLIDGLNGAAGTVRSGGDAAAQLRMQSPPPTEKLMAFFSGPIEVGPDGRAKIEIPKPAFNGTIKLMAVAWSSMGVGDADFEVLARDPVVVSAALPRFLAPGDSSRLQLEFVHASGDPGEMALEIHADSGIELGGAPTSIVMEKDGTTRLSIPMEALVVGDPLITVSLTTPAGAVLRKVLAMPVRDNDPETATTRQLTLAAGETFTLDRNVFAGVRPGTGTATLAAGPLARFDVPGLLRQLDRYPYGCTEQVTSGALPLLYVGELAQSAGIGEPAEIAHTIEKAIGRVLSRQASNGAFGLWRSGSGEFWLDAYVTDFLSRARAKGYAVSDRAFGLALDNLRNRVNYAPDFDSGGEDIAYALLVLAREGAASMSDLRYYADTKAGQFGTPMAVAQLGAALATYGDSLRADALFGRASAMINTQSADRRWRADFGSHLRDTAAVLKLGAEAGSNAVDAALLTASLHQPGKNLSSQEAAQVVMAAQALARPGAVPGVTVDGVPSSGPIVRQLSDRDDAASRIENAGTQPLDITLTTFGVPEIPAEAGGYGYAIRRSYYSMDGDLVSGPVGQGERLVTVLEIQPFEEIGARLIIDDPLPAGFEIDNPNLLRGGDVASLEWLETAATETAEFRADRFIAAVNSRDASLFRLAYVVRAVTPGSYHHPAAIVQDMYRPEYLANTGTGRLAIIP